MTSSEKLHYLYDRGEELDEERRKRVAVEALQEEWLRSERAKAVQCGVDALQPVHEPGPSQAKAGHDSDYGNLLHICILICAEHDNIYLLGLSLK